MSPQSDTGTGVVTETAQGASTHRSDPDYANQVRLLGRVSSLPEERTLPSGDVVWTFRLIVGRPPPKPGAHQSRQTVDTLDCAVWTGRVRRSVTTWREGDVVEVTGAIRRRFYRGGGSLASRVEVEVDAGRLIRRATPA